MTGIPDPSEPERAATEPGDQPEPAAEPTELAGEPTEPAAEPTEHAGEPTEPAAEPTGPAQSAAAPVPVPPVESTRRLLGASFDLITRASDDMRRASFYIGIVVLGTVGPLALASFGLAVASTHRTEREMTALMAGGVATWLSLLGILAGLGAFVAAIESRAMAVAILGGHFAGRPIAVRAALARSRTVFWRVILASFMVGIPVGIGQSVISAVLEAILGPQADVSIVAPVLAAAVVGAPFAYLLGGIVLGDVGPVEAMRRSFRVFRARKPAAALVAVFETIAILLVFLGLGAGLDIALRVFDALGLGPDSDPVGLALVTIGILAGVFALGTLIYTAFAISLAPQVVMFVGLTRATFGLDHVRPGGDRDPTGTRPAVERFRSVTRPMLLGFVAGAVGLTVCLTDIAR